MELKVTAFSNLSEKQTKKQVNPQKDQDKSHFLHKLFYT